MMNTFSKLEVNPIGGLSEIVPRNYPVHQSPGNDRGSEEHEQS